MHRRHVVAADQHALGVQVLRIGGHQHDRAEADDERQQIEVADETGCPEHGLARLASIGDGKEAHQDMRQTRRAEHQRQAERDRRHRVLHQRAGLHDRGVLRRDLDGLLEQRLHIEAERVQHAESDEAGAAQQQDRLDDLHPGCGQHAAERHIDDHQNANDDHGVDIVQTEQQPDQLPGADHLGDQIERNHGQRARCRQHADGRLRQSVRHHVGEGEAAEIAQPLRHQEHDDRPADQEADRVDQPVIARAVDQRGNPQERRRRHVVAGDREPVLEPGDACARGVELRPGARPLRRPIGDAEGEQHEAEEHGDGDPVRRLLDRRAFQGANGPGRRRSQGQQRRHRQRCKEASH